MKRALMLAFMMVSAASSSALVHASPLADASGCNESMDVTLLLPPYLANLQDIRMTFTTASNGKSCSEAVQVGGRGPVRRISLHKAAASGGDGRLVAAVMERDHVRCNVAQAYYDKGPSVVCQ